MAENPEIHVRLGIDTTEYERGLRRASELASSTATLIGNSYSQNLQAWRETVRVQEQIADSYAAAGRAYQASALAFVQSGGLIFSASREQFRQANAAIQQSLTSFSAAGTAAKQVIEQYGSSLTKVSLMLSGFGATLTAPFILGVREASAFEDSMVQVRRTLDVMGGASESAEKNLQDIAKGLRDISSESGMSTRALASIAQEAGRLGLRSSADVLKFTDSIQKISQVTGMSAPAAARDLGNLAKSLDFPITEMDRLGSAIVEVGRAATASDEQIIGLTQLLGTSAKNAGFNTAQILATTAAIASMGGVSSRAAMQFNMLLLRMTESVQVGDDLLPIFAKVTGMVNDQIRSGQDFARLFRDDSFKAMQQFFQGLVASGDKAQIALDRLGMGGAQATRVFLKFGEQIQTLDGFLQKSNTALEEGTALTKQYANAQATLTSMTEDLGRAVEAALVEAYEDSLPVLKAAAGLLHAIIQEVREHPLFMKLAAAVTTAAGAFSLLAGSLGLTARGMLGVVSEMGTIASAINDVTGNKKIQEMVTSLGSGFKSLGAAAVLAGNAVMSVGSAFLSGGMQAGFAAMGPTGWAVLGFIALTTALTILEAKTGLVSKAFFATVDVLKALTVATYEFIGGLYVIARDDIWGSIVLAASKAADAVVAAWELIPDPIKAVFSGLGGWILNWAIETGKSAGRGFYDNFISGPAAVVEYVRNRFRNQPVEVPVVFEMQDMPDMTLGKMGGSLSDRVRTTVATIAPGATKPRPTLDVEGKTTLARMQSEAKKIMDDLTNAQVRANADIEQRMVRSTDNVIRSLSDQVRSHTDASNAILTQREAIHLRLKMLDDEEAAANKANAINRTVAYQSGEQAIKDFNAGVSAAEAQRYAKRKALETQLAQLDKDEAKSYADSLQAQIDMTRQASEEIAGIRLEMSKKIADLSRPPRSGLEQFEQDMLDRQKAIADRLDILTPGTREYTDALEAQAEAYALLTKQIDDYITKGLDESRDALNGARAAMGLDEWTEDFQRLTLAHKEYHKSYADLAPLERDRIDRLARTRAEILQNARAQEDLTNANVLYRAGLDKIAAVEMAQSVRRIREAEAEKQALIDIYETLNNARQRADQQHAQILQGRAQHERNYYQFSVGSLLRYAAQLDTVWQGIDRMIQNTLGNIQRTLADTFFNLFTGQSVKLKDVWKDLLNSMLRELANFMASAAVKAFLSFAGNLLQGQPAGTAASNALGGLLGTGGTGRNGGSSSGGGLTGSSIGGIGDLLGSVVKAIWPSTTTVGLPTVGTQIGSTTSSGGGMFPGGFDQPSGYQTSYVPVSPSTSFGYDPGYTTDYSVPAFAAGGRVPGGGRGDIVPAMLEPGEFVVRRSVAEQMGPVLEKLNGGGGPGYSDGRLTFATGGTVPVIEARSITQEQLLAALLMATNRQTAVTQTIAQNTGQSTNTLTAIAKDGGVTNVPSWISQVGGGGGGGADDPAMAGFLQSAGLISGGLRAGGSVASATGFGGVASGALGLAGLTSLAQGILAGNPYVAAGGGLTALQGFSSLAGYPLISQGFGALTGAVGVAQGIQQGNYLQAAAGGTQTLASIANILASQRVATALGYGSGAIYNPATGAFTPTLGGALGVAGGALGVAGGGLNIYQGIQTGNVSQIASGAYGAITGASAISGYFGGPTISGALATAFPSVFGPAASAAGGSTVALGADAGIVAGASGGVSGATGGASGAIAPATAAVGYVATLAAIAFGIWSHQEAVKMEQMRHGIIEANAIRRGYAEAVPVVLDSIKAVDQIAVIGQMPEAQRIPALLNLKSQLEAGWSGLSAISHFIETKGTGNQASISRTGRADTTQAELLSKIGTPVVSAGLARVYDALGAAGVPVMGTGILQPLGANDIASLLNRAALSAGAGSLSLRSGAYADLLANAVPGNFSATMATIFANTNPNFAQSDFARVLGMIPDLAAVPMTPTAQMQMQQAAIMRQEAIAQARQVAATTGNIVMAEQLAPYVRGGITTTFAEAVGRTPESIAQQTADISFYSRTNVHDVMNPQQIQSYLQTMEQSQQALFGPNYGMAKGGLVQPNAYGMAAGGMVYGIDGQLFSIPGGGDPEANPGGTITKSQFLQGVPPGMSFADALRMHHSRATAMLPWVVPDPPPMSPTDTVPKMLTPGEFVVPRDITSRNLDKLVRLQRTGQWEQGRMEFSMPSQASHGLVTASTMSGGRAVSGMPMNISITIYGDVVDPRRTAEVLAQSMRDVLRRTESRNSRAGNKSQG